MKIICFAVAAICCAGVATAQKQQQEDPCQVKSKVVGDVTYCDRYWECVNGQPELYDCPNGLVYAGKHRGVTEGCDYPWRANYCDGKQLANGPLGTDHCDWLYGIFGHESSCTRYWTCWNGTATEQLCIGGLLYNENTHSCDWPENVEGCQKHPLCTEDANGNVPLGKSCNRYWQCQGGYPRLQRCPAMLVFDRRSLRCVVPPTEDCDIPTTPAPSPDELDDEEENVPPQQSRPGQHQQIRQQNQDNRQQNLDNRQQNQDNRQQNQDNRQRNQDNRQKNHEQQNQDHRQQQNQQNHQRNADNRQQNFDNRPNIPNLPPGVIPLPPRGHN